MLILGGILFVSATQSECPLNEEDYDEFFSINEKLISVYGDLNINTSDFSVGLSPGNYEVTLVANDYYPSRVDVFQPNEQYMLAFEKDGFQEAMTSPTEDLEDYTESDEKILTENVYLPNGADSFKAVHAKFAEVETETPNSVNVVCIGIKKIEEPEIECGNNILEEGEQCDRGLANGFLCWAGYGSSCTYCTTQCKLKTITNFCGDGIKQACEECDDGNEINDDNCNNQCKKNILPVCGNGKVESGESCDDGNLNNGDGCSAICESEEEPSCEYDVGIRYESYESSNTGIGIKKYGGSWSSENNLEKGNYTFQVSVKNKDPVENVTLVFAKFKINGNEIGLEGIDKIRPEKFSYPNIEDYDISNLQCGVYYNISVEVSKENCVDKNPEDNFASRQIYIECENPEPTPYCGDGIVNQITEECDGTSDCTSDCKIKNTDEKTKSHGNIVEYFECAPNWECSGWSECDNGIMTRKCTDKNFCDYSYNKPIESSICTIKQTKIEEGNKTIFLFIAGVVLLVILLLILINLLR